MHNFSVILRSKGDHKEITIRANSGESAQSEALSKAAELTTETGEQWRVSRCDPA